MSALNLLLIIAGVNMVVLTLNAMFWWLVSRGERKIKIQENELMQRFDAELERGHQAAQQLLKEASTKAQELLHNSQVLVEDIKQSMRENFRSVAENHQRLLGEQMQALQNEQQVFLRDFREGFQKDMQKMVEVMFTDLDKQMRDSLEAVKQQSLSAQEDIHKRLAGEYEKAVQEIEVFREQRKAEVEKHLTGMVKKTIEAVLDEELTLEVQEQTIRKAFEKATKEGMFKTTSNKQLTTDN